ncbi:MAG: N-6 DNA methylase [Acidobacteria bacterium]|nr:N-6 DNA methylase [Acidobacteriota bacterium]
MPLPGVSGSLVSVSYVEESLDTAFGGRLGETSRDGALRALQRWVRRAQSALGPASSDRAVLDVAILPLLELLGYEVDTLGHRDGVGFVGRLRHRGVPVAMVLALSWNARVDRAWREAVRLGLERGTRWVLAANGTHLDVFDAGRTWARRFLSFNLPEALSDPRSAAIVWALARADALAPGRDGHALLELTASASDRHGSRVRASLGDGVLEALTALLTGLDGRRMPGPPAGVLFDHALTIVYRVLFLLFAEARGLVPTWHHVYAQAYTVDRLCRQLAERPRVVGLWDALQAITRLLHEGCDAGDLHVTPFNGRLFAPARTPLATRLRVPDKLAAQALLALATGPAARRFPAAPRQEPADPRASAPRCVVGRRRIDYAELGVEQLGAVYERVLEYEAVRAANGVELARTSSLRKVSGSFYTPRSITDFLVRRALHPLVAGRSADNILSLRIVDPAMGSGAFLVAACHYLADAVERALVDDGSWPADASAAAERASVRRQVAERCLYGVDVNPTAVQVARLSLWLYTLAGDRPLSFLDHHLAVGDSLVGARLSDLARPFGGARRTAARQGMPCLFDADAAPALASAVPERFRLALEASDTLSAVRDKERRLQALESPDSPLMRWKSIADVWCASWFREDERLSPPVLGELTAYLLGRGSSLPARQVVSLLGAVAHVARSRRTFHWELAFPEVFFHDTGERRRDAGFDAVLGNPPWEVLKADSGVTEERAGARPPLAMLVRFLRDAGVYALSGAGHPNQYQLFLERSWQLLRPGGRFGLILPSGLATDHGSAHLRRALLTSKAVDSLLGFDNRRAIFPIHRSTRFLLVAGSNSGETRRLRCRFGLDDPSVLDRLADNGGEDPAPTYPIHFDRALLERWDPQALAIPELADARDLSILATVCATVPALGQALGWHVRFGRELNATDDRRHFVARVHDTGGLLPIVEGKHLDPFRVRLDATTHAIPLRDAQQLIDPAASYARPRLAYRDVSGRTNRLTLIAALLPAGTISTHTVFCAKTPLDEASSMTLLALLNSLVANYLVRLRVATHVTTAIIHTLPVPRPRTASAAFSRLATLARRLEQTGIDGDLDAYAHANAIAAHLYGLSVVQYEHIVGTFPLLPAMVRTRCVGAYAEATRHDE